MNSLWTKLSAGSFVVINEDRNNRGISRCVLYDLITQIPSTTCMTIMLLVHIEIFFFYSINFCIG